MPLFAGEPPQPWRHHRFAKRAALAAAIVCLVGLALVWGLRSLGRDYVGELQRMYPNADTQTLGGIGSASRQYKVPFGDRCILIYQAKSLPFGLWPVRNRFGTAVLLELKSVTFSGNEVLYVQYDRSKILKESDWDLLVASNGDIEAIWPGVRVLPPVPGFQQAYPSQ